MIGDGGRGESGGNGEKKVLSKLKESQMGWNVNVHEVGDTGLRIAAKGVAAEDYGWRGDGDFIVWALVFGRRRQHPTSSRCAPWAKMSKRRTFHPKVRVKSDKIGGEGRERSEVGESKQFLQEQSRTDRRIDQEIDIQTEIDRKSVV